MRRVVFLAVMALWTLCCAAQDTLVLRNGETRKVEVREISRDSVKFVRYGTTSPLYTYPVSDIDYIQYPNGEKDTFAPQIKRGPVQPLAGVPIASAEVKETEPEVKRYKSGDLYDCNGIRGLVIEVDQSGEHGTLASIEEGCVEWCSQKSRYMKAIGITDAVNGQENMRRLEEFIAANSLSWTDFPAFAWCRALGEGWYLPAVNEVWFFGTVYNGGNRTRPNRDVRKIFNDLIRDYGGRAINNIMMYVSSTEYGRTECKYATLGSKAPYFGTAMKRDRLYVRAFRKF